MQRFRIAALLSSALALYLSAACASAAAGRAGNKVGDQKELTVAQMTEVGAQDLFEAVQRLRPLWLRTRSPSSVNAPNTILVYLNETRLGGIDALRGYPLAGVVKLTYLDGTEAANRLLGTGTTVVDGAIIIQTR